MRRIILTSIMAVLIACFLVGYARADNAVFYGLIKDSFSKEPLPQATVTIISEAGVFQAVTDAGGEYRFERVSVPNSKKQNYSVIISKDGYLEADDSRTFRSGKTYRKDYNLKKSTSVLYGRVKDKSSGGPLSGVDVEINARGYSFSAVTGTDGGYRIEGIAVPGGKKCKYDITVSGEGYYTKKSKKTLKAGLEHKNGYLLKPNIFEKPLTAWSDTTVTALNADFDNVIDIEITYDLDGLLAGIGEDDSIDIGTYNERFMLHKITYFWLCLYRIDGPSGYVMGEEGDGKQFIGNYYYGLFAKPDEEPLHCSLTVPEEYGTGRYRVELKQRLGTWDYSYYSAWVKSAEFDVDMLHSALPAIPPEKWSVDNSGKDPLVIINVNDYEEFKGVFEAPEAYEVRVKKGASAAYTYADAADAGSPTGIYIDLRDMRDWSGKKVDILSEGPGEVAFDIRSVAAAKTPSEYSGEKTVKIDFLETALPQVSDFSVSNPGRDTILKITIGAPAYPDFPQEARDNDPEVLVYLVHETEYGMYKDDQEALAALPRASPDANRIHIVPVDIQDLDSAVTVTPYVPFTSTGVYYYCARAAARGFLPGEFSGWRSLKVNFLGSSYPDIPHDKWRVENRGGDPFIIVEIDPYNEFLGGAAAPEAYELKIGREDVVAYAYAEARGRGERNPVKIYVDLCRITDSEGGPVDFLSDLPAEISLNVRCVGYANLPGRYSGAKKITITHCGTLLPEVSAFSVSNPGEDARIKIVITSPEYGDFPQEARECDPEVLVYMVHESLYEMYEDNQEGLVVSGPGAVRVIPVDIVEKDGPVIVTPEIPFTSTGVYYYCARADADGFLPGGFSGWRSFEVNFLTSRYPVIPHDKWRVDNRGKDPFIIVEVSPYAEFDFAPPFPDVYELKVSNGDLTAYAYREAAAPGEKTVFYIGLRSMYDPSGAPADMLSGGPGEIVLDLRCVGEAMMSGPYSGGKAINIINLGTVLPEVDDYHLNNPAFDNTLKIAVESPRYTDFTTEACANDPEVRVYLVHVSAFSSYRNNQETLTSALPMDKVYTIPIDIPLREAPAFVEVAMPFTDTGTYYYCARSVAGGFQPGEFTDWRSTWVSSLGSRLPSVPEDKWQLRWLGGTHFGITVAPYSEFIDGHEPPPSYEVKCEVGGIEEYFYESAEACECPTDISFYVSAETEESGIIYSAWQASRGGDGDIYFNTSEDNGASWLTEDTRLNVISRYCENPFLACDNRGYVYAVWQGRSEDTPDIYFNYSHDSGLTWQAEDARIEVDGALPRNPRIACDRGGTIYLIWEDESDGRPALYFRRSDDRGGTWSGDTRVDRDDAGAAYSPPAAISCDDKKGVYVVWEGELGGRTDIYFNRSSDGGDTWQDFGTMLNDPGYQASSMSPAICCDYYGGVYAVWVGAEGAGDVFFVASSDGGVTWPEAPIRISDPSPTVSQRRAPDISCDNKGSLYAVWTEQGLLSSAVYFNSSSDWGATWMPEGAMVSEKEFYSQTARPQAACDNGGEVYIAWEGIAEPGRSSVYFNSSYDYGASWLFSDIRINKGDPHSAFCENPRLACPRGSKASPPSRLIKFYIRCVGSGMTPGPYIGPKYFIRP